MVEGGGLVEEQQSMGINSETKHVFVPDGHSKGTFLFGFEISLFRPVILKVWSTDVLPQNLKNSNPWEALKNSNPWVLLNTD